MKTTQDKFTGQLPGIPKKPGRPNTGKAKTNAQRQAEFRQKRRKEQLAELYDIKGAFCATSDKEVGQIIAEGGHRTQYLAWLELGRRKGWLK